MVNCLVLTQYRGGGKYRDFLGHLYHFPKSYLNNFDILPVEFIFYEPIKNGKGEFFGCGEIAEVIPDNESKEHYFAIIKNYQDFRNPVKYRDENGKLIESDSPHYNPQNAVRKIPSKVFDEICLDGGISLKFKSDVHLIKVLGEQLIGSEKVGILELIKNAIDAQATYCKVRIEKVKNLNNSEDVEFEFPDLPGPVIIVEDDGIGMTKEVIEKGWLRPASTIKTNIKEKIKKEREIAKQTGNLGQFDALIK
ncbi:MAG: ATP-binding protein [Candidatus Celaenobacter antarcticus]|nr:ATP-binding protein [Candidatus Celaenobacter antarcticus]